MIAVMLAGAVTLIVVVAVTATVTAVVAMAAATAYLEADVRRNKRKMGGFASWEIFGTGFEIRIFLRFSRNVQVLKFWIFLRFPAIFRGPKKFSKNGFFCSVSGF